MTFPDLGRLAELFGSASDRLLMCKFVSSLPEAVRHAVRDDSRGDSLTLAAVLVVGVLSDG